MPIWKPEYLISCAVVLPRFHENMDWINQQGISIFIDTPLPVIQKRLAASAAARPLVSEIKAEERLAHIQALWERRRPCYLQAQFVIHHPAELEALLAHILTKD
ncbi:MAG: shikimate kinase [Bacteroidia bacterium]